MRKNLHGDNGLNVLRGLVCALFLAALPVAAQPLPDLIERLRPSVVGVGAAYPERAPTGGKPPRRLLGTGFVIEHGGESLVVTNAHVIPTDLDVDRREQLVVYSGRGKDARQHPATVLKRDDEHDLAILSYAPPRLPAMTLGNDELVREGEAVAFTGFPIGAVLGLFPATHTGIVAAITPLARVADNGGQLTAEVMRRLRAPFDVYQLDAIAYPGNSGSAVYRVSTGEVVGVINSVFVKGSRENLLSQPSGIAYAIPVKFLRQLMRAPE